MKKMLILIGIYTLLTLGETAGQETSLPSESPQELPAASSIEDAQRKAEHDQQKAREEAAKKEAEILFEQGTLKDKVVEMEKAKREREKQLEQLNNTYQAQDKEIGRLQERMKEQEGQMNEISGTVRGIAQDLASALRQSLVSGELPGRQKQLDPLLAETDFPSLENIKTMIALIFDEIDRNGDISITTLPFIDAAGRETSGEVIRIGAFNALFHKGNTVGYLEYSPAKQSFHQLTVTPPRSMIREAQNFIKKESHGLYLDPSSGGAFRQLTDLPTWWEELKSGGILMYPIIGVGLLALIFILERLLLLIRESRNTKQLLYHITPLLEQSDWDQVLRHCERAPGSLSEVITTGIHHRQEHQEVLESVLQEAIQSSLPRLERNMSALGICAVVSPLLGLLGTVTGMIATFQMITLYGTGDPRIMSSGISEALVTTQYGLIIAVPIILIHGFLQGRTDRLISILEEKAIMLVNVVKKNPREESNS